LFAICGCTKFNPEPYPEIHGIEINGPPGLMAAVEVAWIPFRNLGIQPPSTIHDITEDEEICGCAGYYNPYFHSIGVVAPYAALPHEFAHHASQILYGHAQDDHNWTPLIRAALNASADAIGMGHEW